LHTLEPVEVVGNLEVGVYRGNADPRSQNPVVRVKAGGESRVGRESKVGPWSSDAIQDGRVEPRSGIGGGQHGRVGGETLPDTIRNAVVGNAEAASQHQPGPGV